ncbi:MAG: ABC transporter ATP-binding protein [Candidatus Latescibacterota bacterium]|nr:MAG: ABC transporter ATP-binding protein [Candidatus Latescibacterota bacterium]
MNHDISKRRQAEAAPLLEIRELTTEFETPSGVARAVDGATLEVRRGEIVGLVGESGCGKSVTALSILGLLPHPGRVVAGEIRFDGRSLLNLDSESMRSLRGREIAMVFQEPASALNPVFSCGEQIAEVLRTHRRMKHPQARARAVELLTRVRFPDPARLADRYPHELSGGMCQRVMLAMALACGPKLLVADEPTTALDVTVQAQILDLILELQRDTGMAVLLITHDLGVVAQVATRVAVMYAGRVVEAGARDALFETPQHPYTSGLLRSRPRLSGGPQRLDAIPGALPDPTRLPGNCRFFDRCPRRVERCRLEDPPPRRVRASHEVRCFVDPSPEAQ